MKRPPVLRDKQRVSLTSSTLINRGEMLLIHNYLSCDPIVAKQDSNPFISGQTPQCFTEHRDHAYQMCHLRRMRPIGWSMTP